jgi:hypothetical protein
MVQQDLLITSLMLTGCNQSKVIKFNGKEVRYLGLIEG